MEEARKGVEKENNVRCGWALIMVLRMLVQRGESACVEVSEDIYTIAAKERSAKKTKHLYVSFFDDLVNKLRRWFCIEKNQWTYALVSFYLLLINCGRAPKKHEVKNRRILENTQNIRRKRTGESSCYFFIYHDMLAIETQKIYSPGFYNRRLSRLLLYAINSHRVQKYWRSYGLKTLGQIWTVGFWGPIAAGIVLVLWPETEKRIY